MTTEFRATKKTIMDILADAKSSVVEVASYAPHIKNNERIFAIYDYDSHRFADFSVHYFTDNIVRYKISIPYQTPISRIAFTRSKFQRPGVRAMQDIHTAISLKSRTK